MDSPPSDFTDDEYDNKGREWHDTPEWEVPRRLDFGGPLVPRTIALPWDVAEAGNAAAVWRKSSHETSLWFHDKRVLTVMYTNKPIQHFKIANEVVRSRQFVGSYGKQWRQVFVKADEQALQKKAAADRRTSVRAKIGREPLAVVWMENTSFVHLTANLGWDAVYKAAYDGVRQLMVPPIEWGLIKWVADVMRYFSVDPKHPEVEAVTGLYLNTFEVLNNTAITRPEDYLWRVEAHFVALAPLHGALNFTIEGDRDMSAIPGSTVLMKGGVWVRFRGPMPPTLMLTF